MYKLVRINNIATALLYCKLTSPQLRTQLQNISPEGNILAVGATESNRAVGLIFAEIWSDNKTAQVLSIFVVPTHRNRGIGTALLTYLEKELFLRGCTKVKLFDINHQPTTHILEKLLYKCKWGYPQPFLLEYQTDLVTILRAPWINNKYRLSSDMMIFPWIEVTNPERIVIQQTQEENVWIDKWLNPFEHEDGFEPLNSLGLRYQRQVVGWILTKQIRYDTISYNCMFVRQDLQKMGKGIVLIVKAIQRQAESGIPKCIFQVRLSNYLMIRFVKKHMSPYLFSIAQGRDSYKLLTDLSVKESVNNYSSFIL